MIQKFKVGQKVRIKNELQFRPTIYKIFGYADPEYSDLVYIIDTKNMITTVSENILEEVPEKLHYKGYSTTVQYSDEDGVYFGHIEEIKALVNWESDTEENCKKEFESAVDDYVSFCQSYGLDPNEDRN